MKLKLTLSERWGAINVLAGVTTGSLKDLKIVSVGLKALQITKAEREEYGISVVAQTVSWSKDSAKKTKEFAVDGELPTLLKLRLQQLSDTNAMKSEMIDIAEKLGVQ